MVAERVVLEGNCQPQVIAGHHPAVAKVHGRAVVLNQAEQHVILIAPFDRVGTQPEQADAEGSHVHGRNRSSKVMEDGVRLVEPAVESLEGAALHRGADQRQRRRHRRHLR